MLVTGATDGIGLHTAKQLAKMGADVLVHGRCAFPELWTGCLSWVDQQVTALVKCVLKAPCVSFRSMQKSEEGRGCSQGSCKSWGQEYCPVLFSRSVLLRPDQGPGAADPEGSSFIGHFVEQCWYASYPSLATYTATHEHWYHPIHAALQTTAVIHSKTSIVCVQECLQTRW